MVDHRQRQMIIRDSIDTVRSLQPTSRTADSRVWGPFPDGQHPGYWVRLTVKRIAKDRFTFVAEESRALDGT